MLIRPFSALGGFWSLTTRISPSLSVRSAIVLPGHKLDTAPSREVQMGSSELGEYSERFATVVGGSLGKTRV